MKIEWENYFDIWEIPWTGIEFIIWGFKDVFSNHKSMVLLTDPILAAVALIIYMFTFFPLMVIVYTIGSIRIRRSK